MTRLADNYREVHRPTLRGWARRAALDTLTMLPAASRRLADFRDVPRVQFLVMHHVFDDEQAGFRRLVAFLRHHFELVPYSVALGRLASGSVTRPMLAFTFDDGLKNCLAAARILEEHDTRGCFFVCPGFVGQQRPELLRRICRERWAMPPTELMTWDDLEQLVNRGHEVCAHTMAHPYLHQLPLETARREIILCRQSLLEQFGVADHFAWPYGGFHHMRAEIAEEVFRAGFRSCASGQRGAHAAVSTAGSRFCVRRDSLVAAWPLRHAEYFLASSAQRPITPDKTWPTGWSVASSQRTIPTTSSARAA